MFSNPRIRTCARRIDVKIGYVPVLNQIAYYARGFEALKLAEPFDCQNITRIKTLLFPPFLATLSQFRLIVDC